MRLPELLRTWLRPLVRPIRAAMERRVVALIDARLAEFQSKAAPVLVEPTGRLADTDWQAASLRRIDEQSHPNADQLWVILRDLDNAKLTIKFFGYELGRALSAALPVRTDLAPRHVGLRSKPSTQADLEADWAAYWIAELKSAHIFHRKLWEFAYVLQAIFEQGLLRAGARGLGFGCGEEPLPSYLASRGIHVTVTDIDPSDAGARGWIETNQHTSSREKVFQDHLVDRRAFDELVDLRYVDMNNIPSDLCAYDFCWSICALEHIGSIRKGLDFIEASLRTLRPGGVAIHTTEFNFLDDQQTIDDWPTVLFQKKHFRAIAERLEAQGHRVAPLDFDYGDGPLDKFIDIPPYTYNWPPEQQEYWGQDAHHLKVSVDGFACTCFGIVICKSEQADDGLISQ